MAENPVRFGILGCAEIARKVSRAINLAPNCMLYAIGSRSIEKAKKFVNNNQILETVTIYGSYDEVLDDPHVDAVYVPLPTSLHVHWAVSVAEKKKHVLLEKPTAVDVDGLDRILEACHSNGVQFMDGTMWLHHPRTTKMWELMSDTRLFGHINSIHSTSTYAATTEFLENNIRTKPDLDSLGALGDAGWYCIGAILWAKNYELPKTITALPAVDRNHAGVILACSASLLFRDGNVATFHSSFLSNESMVLAIYATVGTLYLEDFIIPYNEKSSSFSFSSGAHFIELHTGWSSKPELIHVASQLPQEALMVQEFSRMVKSIRDSRCSPDRKWPEISRKNQLVLDGVKKSIELGFKPVDL